MVEVTPSRRFARCGFGKISAMTSATLTSTPDLALDGGVAATAAADQHAAARAETRRMITESGRKLENAGWISLVLGVVIATGTFASIAWHDSVASRGEQTTVSVQK